MNIKKKILFIVLSLIIIGLAFYGGIYYGKYLAKSKRIQIKSSLLTKLTTTAEATLVGDIIEIKPATETTLGQLTIASPDRKETAIIKIFPTDTIFRDASQNSGRYEPMTFEDLKVGDRISSQTVVTRNNEFFAFSIVKLPPIK